MLQVCVFDPIHCEWHSGNRLKLLILGWMYALEALVGNECSVQEKDESSRASINSQVRV